MEALLGVDLPARYLSFLSQPYSLPTKRVGVPFRGELWDVHAFYRLDDGPSYRQLDATFNLVHDALPPFTLPIARDHAGNFFCIVVAGEREGHIVWWDHERVMGDHHVEDVADSLNHFMGAITEFS